MAGTFSRDLTKPSPCSAGILPGLSIWKNQYPRYSPALGGVVHNGHVFQEVVIFAKKALK